MSTVLYDHTLTEMLQTASELIVIKPKEEQAQWVLFLLGEIKALLPKQGYQELAAAVQEDLAKQLAES